MPLGRSGRPCCFCYYSGCHCHGIPGKEGIQRLYDHHRCLLKPAYNVQIAVNSEYITGIDVFSNRSAGGLLKTPAELGPADEEFITEDKNAASLVIYYEEGDFTGLFTGDIGNSEEKWIVEHSKDWLDCQKNNDRMDFYKVAHHGSKFSNSEELLNILKPKIAVISSGENNSYGHPHKEAVERMEEAECEILNTAKRGQVMIDMSCNVIKSLYE